MYKLTYSKTAEKQLSKLERTTKERIVIALERSLRNPFSQTKKMVGNQYFRLRVGDYRIIMRIWQNELRILVVEIGHRKNIYDS